MVEPPSGTVTFLFTDIEGSTRLLQELGDRYEQVEAGHAEIVRRAIADGGGTEIRTEGDSFFAVFPHASGGVRGAVAAQRALAKEPWPDGVAIRVRMGMHTGEGRTGGSGAHRDYVGIDVNRAARIAAAAHGGQVLVSDATRGLVEHDLPEGVTIRELGEHRLKDLDHPERLHDLVIDGLPADFPPLRTLEVPTSLPPERTSFIGREREIEDVTRLLDQTRLLTLTGPGGTGKTRLALRVASIQLDRFREGAFWVDLSSITDPGLVPSAIASALQVREQPGRDLVDVVGEHLRDRQMLVVLDNVEHVAEAASGVGRLLDAAQELTVLATSRVPLRLSREREYQVSPLALPQPGSDVEALSRCEAVILFTDRALARRPSFRLTDQNAQAVAHITSRLDGLPLAIELAASRLNLLDPGSIAARLDRRLPLLTGGARDVPERQRTLRGAIEWSHDLLSPEERRLFARLAVFASGWSLEAAEAVCEPGLAIDVLEGLDRLIDGNLVRRREAGDDGVRFRMLETIREYATERLSESGQEEEIRSRHAKYFLDLALEAEPHLTAEDQGLWLDRCDREHPNIRAALRWAIDAGEADRAQESAGALWRFWQQRGHLAEGRGLLEEVLALPSGQEPTRARATALTGAGGIAWWQGDVPAAHSFYDQALAIQREIGDPARLAEALYNEAFVVFATDPGDVETPARLWEESLDLFRRAGDERGAARVLSMLAGRAALAGDWGPMVAQTEEAVAIWRRVGDRFGLADDLNTLALAYPRVGRGADARVAALEALELFLEADNPTGVVNSFWILSFLASWEGRYEDALRLAGAGESLRERTGGGPPLDFLAFLVGDPVADARAQLPEDAAQRAGEEGRSMSVEEAVALARETFGSQKSR